jgi:hypothetical protein
MVPTTADLMTLFTRMRKEAHQRLATPLRDAVMDRFEAQKSGVKTAADLAAIDKALFLHSSVR